MQINQVCKKTGLTRKAIEYYEEQSLLEPGVLENGYRNYEEEDVALLGKISVLRKLSLSVEEIKTVLGGEQDGTALRSVLAQKEMKLQIDAEKKDLLAKLSREQNYEQITEELQHLEQKKTISEKLLEAFPGYYGRFVYVHFVRFLNEPIRTSQQQSAYEAMIDFLDHMPALALTEELKDYLEENTKHLETQQIIDMDGQVRQSVENPEDFLEQNGEFLEWYLAYKQSADYLNSPNYQLAEQLKAFNQSSGYYDVFIPLLRQLSSSYDAYSKQLEAASDILVSRYPQG